ncbi:MAG: glycosyltransferase family 4 protein [Flavobacteriales bacterium]|nr:glycosyltransferase family 4 protein [Flavobacteriales bacterium]
MSPAVNIPARTPRVLVLYTELAPYVLTCLRALAQRGVEVHVVRWPVNSEAPFALSTEGLHLYERKDLDDAALQRLAIELNPDVTLCSGWIDKGYLAACRSLRKLGGHTVMCSDTAWQGKPRQWVAALAGRLILQRTFSAAWVTGERQALYARKLGFAAGRVSKGFYAADTDHFLALGGTLLAERQNAWPHVFLCVARYIAVKNHQLLCDAFAELCEEGHAGDWQLWFAGTGELHGAVSGSASGSHPRIKHLGFVQGEAMRSAMRSAGVFVLPSAYEPWGVVVQEQACAGLPLALSQEVRAGERFLIEGRNGLSFPANDKQRLKEALCKFVAMPDDVLAEQGRASRALGATWSPSDWAGVVVNMIQQQRGQA